MIAHIATPADFVSDQDQALDFDVNALGFGKRADARLGNDRRWLEVAPTGANRAIVLARHDGAREAPRAGQFAGIVFGIDDTYERLRRRGVTFTEPATAQPWGKFQAQLADQDGNAFVLVQP